MYCTMIIFSYIEVHIAQLHPRDCIILHNFYPEKISDKTFSLKFRIHTTLSIVVMMDNICPCTSINLCKVDGGAQDRCWGRQLPFGQHLRALSQGNFQVYQFIFIRVASRFLTRVKFSPNLHTLKAKFPHTMIH